MRKNMKLNKPKVSVTLLSVRKDETRSSLQQGKRIGLQ